MKYPRIICFICLISVQACFLPEVRAQDAPFYQEHPHSLSASTGVPFLLSIMYPPGSGDNTLTWDGQRTGTSYKSWYPAGLNLMYNIQAGRHWEFSLAVSMSGWLFSAYQYPESKETGPEGEPQYDWKAKPEKTTLHFDFRGFIPSVHVRYYWLTRKESYQMYSAAGLGVMLYGYPKRVYPTLTPVGIRFGKQHWFGTAELGLGTTGTGVLLGAGYRF